jgi:hypothetical protein
MSGFFKKLMATGAVLTVGLASVATADNSSCPPPPCAPCNNWCENVSINAAWLYWKVNGDEFDYAVHKERTTSVGSPATTFDKETIHDLKFDYDSGFRIGLAWDTPCFCWGFDLNWTHFDTSSSKEKEFDASTLGSTHISFPVVDNSYADLTGTESAQFRAHSNFRYNTVDLEMGKWCCCGTGAVMFRPHVGFRFADIHETFKDRVEFFGGAVASYPTGATEEHFRTKNRFKGVGLRAGLDVDLRLCDGWSIIGRSAISAVWGHTHLRNNFGYSTTVPDLYDSEIKEHYRQTRFITDLMLGLRFKTMCCGCYPLTIEAAWEHHYLFNQHRFWVDDSYFPNTGGGGVVVQSTTATNSWKKNGDVALSGFTLTAGVDY